MPRLAGSILGCALALIAAGVAAGHDIPNARVDRAIQVDIGPERISIDYEISLAELTLTQDLRALIGGLPGGDRRDWFQRYGEETAALNGHGLLLWVDGESIDLVPTGFDIGFEQHPRFTFHYTATIPTRGSLRLIDSNYAASEGSSRLAIRGKEGVAISGDDGPADVASIAIQPAWRMTPAEDRRSKRVEVTYGPGDIVTPTPNAPLETRAASGRGLSGLLDRAAGTSWPLLGVAAFVLGLAHAVQPGHGKSLVAAGSVGPGGGPWRGVVLGLLATVGHLSSVTALALVIWVTRATDYPDWNALILHVSGFWLAVIGVYRLGHLLGSPTGDALPEARPVGSRMGVVSLGLSAGLVPCWDAVGLLVLASALGRITLGLALVAAFSLGMATVLVGVGALATRLRDLASGSGRWSRRLGLIGAVMLALIGGSFLVS